MTSLPALNPRPSIVVALELLGLEDPELPEERARAALATVVQDLGDPETKNFQEWRLLLEGRRALRAVPIKRGGTLLFWELLDLVHVQSHLVSLGILMRGAIALGNAAALAGVTVGRGLTASRADAFVGTGVVEAERLRDTVAEVPRVIVDPRLIREAEQNADLRAAHHTVAMELGYIRDLLRRDADGLWFVDYLRAFESEVDEPPIYVHFLMEHAQFVRRKLEASPRLEPATRSWTWLWSYHNRIVEACFRRKRITKEERAALRIPAQGPLLYVFPPSAKAP